MLMLCQAPFLRALRDCDVPAFRPGGSSCEAPKVVGSTLVFEGFLNCVWATRRWFHPDALPGASRDQNLSRPRRTACIRV